MKIYNAKIYTMSSINIIENGWVEIVDGKIADIGKGDCPHCDTDYNANGNMLLPGFIDCHTHLGIIENGLGFEGDDCNEESDAFTPHLRAIDGINPLDYCFKEAYSRGITSVIISPGSANAVGGEMVAVKTKGVCIDDMIIRVPSVKFALGENPKTVYNDKSETPITRMAIASIIREGLYKAKRYYDDVREAKEEEGNLPEYDIKCESLLDIIDNSRKAHFHCHRADDICTALRISKEFNIKPVLVHCTEGHLIAEKLGKEQAEAIVGPIICDRSKPELQNHSIATCSQLHDKGVKIAICTDHPVVPIQYLPVSAAAVVKGGLPYYEALKSITINAAEIGLIDDKTGSISIGKDADLQLYSDDPLNIMTEPLWVMIEGNIVAGELN